MQVGPVPDGDGPHGAFPVGITAAFPVQRQRTPIGGSPDGLVHAQVHLEDSGGDAERHGTCVRRSGIAIGGKRHLHAGVEKLAGGGQRLPG